MKKNKKTYIIGDEALTFDEIWTTYKVNHQGQAARKTLLNRLYKLIREGKENYDLSAVWDDSYWQSRRVMYRPKPETSQNDHNTTSSVTDELAALVDILQRARQKIEESEERIKKLECDYDNARKLWVSAMEEIGKLRKLV